MSVLLQMKFTGNLHGQRSISVKRDRLSEIIGNPIRKGEDPERYEERNSQATTRSLLGNESEERRM